MALGLDLSDSRCKLTRASEHLDALEKESLIASEELGPYNGRLGKANPEGWFPLIVRRKDIPKVTQQRLSVIVGDTLHNLRSALDYIVAALVTFDGKRIRTCHQFPIFDKETDYRSKIWPKGRKVGRKHLSGVKYGLVEFESLQPYNPKPNPPPLSEHPLWILDRFSNYDKHRSMVSGLPRLGKGWIPLDYFGDDVHPSQVHQFPQGDWNANGEMNIREFRFPGKLPDPTQVNIDLHIATNFRYIVGPTDRDPFEREIRVSTLNLMREHAGMIVDTFEKL